MEKQYVQYYIWIEGIICTFWFIESFTTDTRRNGFPLVKAFYRILAIIIAIV